MSTDRRYCDIAIGDVFPPEPTRFEVTDAIVDAFLAATGDARAHHVRRSDGARPAPPALAAVYIVEALKARGGRPGGVHARQRFVFHREPMVGDVLFTQGRVADKYERKGRRYIVSETITKDAEGTLVTTGITTGIWGQGE